MADTLEDVLDRAREGIDRSEALGEAQVAVLEAALSLVRASGERLAQSPSERAELLREALASVRAATVATGIAVTRAHRSPVVAAQLPGLLPGTPAVRI
ncbi:hypothetical protein OHT57_06145 [Streptomyces sp. NBC_00285]|uniref:hypothetical protein n=1 Tax=Streptomyces sp. NBC_00285 TaxID=2975700 RepID=UPI002E29E31E|nr:hypothetical protein [Streptomyces sp. NBC_00285]